MVSRVFQFTHQDLIRLGLNPQFVEDYVETRQSVTLNVTEIERLATETERIDGEVDQLDQTVQTVQQTLQQTNESLQQQIDALEQTNQQLGAAEGEITNLQDAVQQNNTAIQNNSTAIQQANNAISNLEDRTRIGTVTTNTNTLPTTADFDVEIVDGNGVILGYMPLFTSRW